MIDPALLSATSALVGALIGAGASLAAAVYTQRYQDRLQRVVRETTKRELVYADFHYGGFEIASERLPSPPHSNHESSRQLRRLDQRSQTSTPIGTSRLKAASPEPASISGTGVA